MSYGITQYLANALLAEILGGGNAVNYAPPSNLYVQLHTGAPGASGTTNISTGCTTRQPIAFATPSSGSITLAGTNPTFTCGGSSVTETLTGISIWDAATGGNCIWTEALNTSRSWSTGDSYTLTSDQLSIGALAS